MSSSPVIRSITLRPESVIMNYTCLIERALHDLSDKEHRFMEIEAILGAFAQLADMQQVKSIIGTSQVNTLTTSSRPFHMFDHPAVFSSTCSSCYLCCNVAHPQVAQTKGKSRSRASFLGRPCLRNVANGTSSRCLTRISG